jgi:hypothetical protein
VTGKAASKGTAKVRAEGGGIKRQRQQLKHYLDNYKKQEDSKIGDNPK